MKTGKLILNGIICQIKFEGYPSKHFEEKINDIGLKELTDNQKWNSFKFSITSNYGYDLVDNKYDSIFIIPNNISSVWKLSNCYINLELTEIVFEDCDLYLDLYK